MPDHPRPPAAADRAAWSAYWIALGMPWRLEPEIGEERQRFLAERRAVQPDIGTGVYPFKAEKLSRADVEWLLATHDSGGVVGPVDARDRQQRHREGLDLRGADLLGVDLHGLPLAHVRGGLSGDEWGRTTHPLRVAAAIQLAGANLTRAHLERALLTEAHLAPLGEVRTELGTAHLQGATLVATRFDGVNLRRADLSGANLQWAQFSDATIFEDAVFGKWDGRYPMLGSVRWNGVNLTMVDWTKLKRLGEEPPLFTVWLFALPIHRAAVRANRQLAAQLRAQGLHEEADHFSYRAVVRQRGVLLRQGHLLQYLFSLFLALLAGYGFRPVRTLLWYLVVIVGFAWLYFHVGQLEDHPFTPDGALVFSVTSFHGRGFFPGGLSLEDAITKAAAVEALVGLLIEISFVATFTQRFFGAK